MEKNKDPNKKIPGESIDPNRPTHDTDEQGPQVSSIRPGTGQRLGDDTGTNDPEKIEFEMPDASDPDPINDIDLTPFG